MTICAKLCVLLAVVCVTLGAILAVTKADLRELKAELYELEAIPPEAPMLWSLSEGTHGYMAEETTGVFASIYRPGMYNSLGQTQYKGLAIVCAMGVPQAMRDDSVREAWCVIWRYDAETELWVADDIPYFWGSTSGYEDWRKAEGLD